MLKQLHFLLTALLLLTGSIPLWAQNKVQTSVTVFPPFSANFFEQMQQGKGIMVQLNYPDVNTASRLQIKLLFSLKGDNGVELNMNPSFSPSSPLVLSANQNLPLQGIQLSEYFREENFEYGGISPQNMQLGGLPEGTYRLCVQVVDYHQQDVVYSPQTCSNAFNIRYSDPPALIRPQHKEVLKEVQAQNLIFSWQPFFGAQPGTQYLLKIVEVVPYDREPNDAMESATTPALLEKTTSASTFLYTPDLPRLVSGKTYAWQVMAVGFKGQRLLMKNNGRSEVNTFTIAADSTGGCNCSITNPTIQRTAKSPNFFSYQGTVTGGCFGDTSCQGVNRIEYLWSIVSGSAFIDGPNNQSTVNVTTNGPTTFEVALTGTVVCSDSSRCSATSTFKDTMAYESKSCSCNVDVDCKKVSTQGTLRTFTGVLNGGCTGEYGVTAPYTPCDIKNVVWSWQVLEGNDVAEIEGAADQQTVNVRIKGSGPYQMRVQADVECSDGTKTCGEFNFDYCFDTAVAKKCSFVYTESNQPGMAGGLSEDTKKRERIRRDDFVALVARGRDWDRVTIECTPSYECDNAEKKSTKDVLLAGKIRFEWEMQVGEGNFVKLGALPKNVSSDVGDRVLFQPPYVPLSTTGTSNSKSTVIFLRIIDETGTGPLLDQNVYDRITITTTRTNANPDHYDIDITDIPWFIPNVILQEDNNGICKAEYSWDKPNDLTKPVIKLPAVADNSKLVLGQRMILEANNQNETDELKMLCNASDCEDDGGKKEYFDDIVWTWSIQNDDGTKGKLVAGVVGRYVIYEAPEKMPTPNTNEITVNIVVTVANNQIQKNDIPFTSNPITFKIFRPGVQVEYPLLTWLPEDGNSVSLKSSLLYFEGGIWKPALAHMSRIHFFELLDVSTEKGITMNDPPANAKQCRDLLFKKESHTEVFSRNNPPMPNCTRTTLFVHSRTQKPLKEATVKVSSEDFGSYGFLRSFANINQGAADSIKGQTPVYEPIPIPPAMVPHPLGRAKKNIYKDNRVTVPRDVDENRIADNGWTAIGGAKMSDPQFPRNDNDNLLNGDGFLGDGLSNYEEYRGFFVKGSPIRTNIMIKDLFVHNPDLFDFHNLRVAATPLQIHEIREEEYGNSTRREINFNFNPFLRPTPFPGEVSRIQKGLLIRSLPAIDKTTNGRIVTTVAGGGPAPPNWVTRVEMFEDNIIFFAIRRGVDYIEKANQVSIHEMSHAMNVWHHGRAPNGDQNIMHGVRSGNMGCFMRYDNRLPRVAGFVPELIAVGLCSSPVGTGYNGRRPCIQDECFHDALVGRGNCKAQFRISGRSQVFPRR